MEVGKYDARDVSKCIINHGCKMESLVSNLRLQKLLYFVQAEHLARDGKPCFFNKIEAWGWGPVVPDVYYEYNMYGSAFIPWIVDRNVPNLDDCVDKVIVHVMEKFRSYSPWALVNLTHMAGPWRECYEKGKNVEIKPERILEAVKSSKN